MILQERGYVLHSRSYKETSVIVNVLSENQGILSLLAKGAKRKNNYTVSVLQPFTALMVTYRQQSGYGLGLLQNVDVAQAQRYVLQGKQLICGLYINELLSKLLGKMGIACEQLFALYQSSLQQLYHLENMHDIQRLLRSFEKQLLAILGYALVLSEEASTGEPIIAEQWYDYYPEFGPVATSKAQILERGTGYRIQGQYLLALEGDALNTTEHLRIIKQFMRYILNYYLEGKVLVARSYFR